jgi:hypothetical protein
MNAATHNPDNNSNRAPRAESRATYWRRRALALTAAAVLVGAAAEGIDAVHDLSEGNKLVAQLEKAGPQADEQYFKGDFADKNVVAVKLAHPGTAYSAAASMAAEADGDVLQLQNIVVAQLGNAVESEEIAVVPKDLIDPKTPGQLAPLPDDPQTHVG